MRNDLVGKIERAFLPAKKWFDSIAIVGVFYILLYQVKTLRNFCKGVCVYIVQTDASVDTIKELYFIGENAFKIIILVSIMLSVAVMVIRWGYDIQLKKKKGENRFEESVFRYLRNKAVPRCFLVTGKWGTGKTYEVNKFFEKYYKYSSTPIYRVSCFGLSTRKDLIEEISNTMEAEDDSFYSNMIKMMHFLPVIGEVISKLLKKSYGYNSIKKNAILIFDDFERISSRMVRDDHVMPTYENAVISNSNARLARDYTEFADIRKEFVQVQKAFARIDGYLDRSLMNDDYEKYIAIIGLINELTELYGIKVIIICNTDILGEKFVHDVLRSKLNCMEYRKAITLENKLSIIDSVINDKVFDDDEKQECIIQFITYAKNNIEEMMEDTIFKDLRLFCGLLEAFIDTILLFPINMYKNDFMCSMFNSIIITHLFYYRNSIDKLDKFVNGANINFLLRMFVVTDEKIKLVRLNNVPEETRWIDVSVSGYWIFNFSVPTEIVRISEQWSNYSYFGLEESMLEDKNALMLADDYSLLHILFYQRKLGGKEEWNCKPYIETVLKQYNLQQNYDVQKILDMVGGVEGVYVYQDFLKNLFEELKKEIIQEEIIEHTYVHRMYNEFCESGTFQ